MGAQRFGNGNDIEAGNLLRLPGFPVMPFRLFQPVEKGAKGAGRRMHGPEGPRPVPEAAGPDDRRNPFIGSRPEGDAGSHAVAIEADALRIHRFMRGQEIHGGDGVADFLLDDQPAAFARALAAAAEIDPERGVPPVT